MDSTSYGIIIRTYNIEPMGEGDLIQIPGKIDTNSIKKLNEPLKALAAFYSAIGGTNCSDSSCDLTDELGLGRQGSYLHQALIKKYFPNDKLAATVLKQECFNGKSGSCCFSDYEYLTLTDKGDTVKVDYNLFYEAHENFGQRKGTDTYLFKKGTFFKLIRNIWNEVDN